jgi:hypothetical protein
MAQFGSPASPPREDDFPALQAISTSLEESTRVESALPSTQAVRKGRIRARRVRPAAARRRPPPRRSRARRSTSAASMAAWRRPYGSCP